MEQAIQTFFAEYEAANASSDAPRIGRLYADWLMFAGPNGVQTVKKEDFLHVIPKMKAHFALLGVRETRLNSVEAAVVNSRYLLAKVSWRILLSNSGAENSFVDASASYVLDGQGRDGLTIIVQIDDQDLAAAITKRQGRTAGE